MNFNATQIIDAESGKSNAQNRTATISCLATIFVAVTIIGCTPKPDTAAPDTQTLQPKTPNLARCVGNPQREQCEKQEIALAAESPEAAAKRRADLQITNDKNLAIANAGKAYTPPHAAESSPSQLVPVRSIGNYIQAGGWICSTPVDAVGYSRLRQAGAVMQYKGCLQVGANLPVTILSTTSLAGTDIVNVGNAGGAGWTSPDDLR